MARQFAILFGGTLNVSAQGRPSQPLEVELALPIAERTPVLFIDDNADTLQLMQRYLTGTQYRFVGTRDPEQALDLAEDVTPKVIVLDIMLPGVDGWELLGRLREHPSVGGVPILVCTILPQDKLALTLGAAGFVRKPVSREALLAALNHQMDQRQSR
jgi:CheY-like chemotaxis protein